jgi:gamma-glutamyltranspeptidase/glutathione hydrolase
MASQAGIEIMATGGNAVDAAIAINAVLGVVAPDTCGPGGDLFALVHIPGEARPRTLNSSGRAGSGLTANDLRDMGHGEITLQSKWSITVPGCVDGWHALSDELGNLSVAECLAPAIDIARSGFPVSVELADALVRIQHLIGGQGSASPLYPNGEPAPFGSTISRHQLAETLEAVASGGRRAFFEGEVGAGIIQASGGAITPDDLAVDQAEWIAPAGIDVFSRTAWTIPPNSQGYLTLATLWIFEHLDPPTDSNDPLFQHLLIESYRSVAWERAQYATEPSTAPMTVDELLDPIRLEQIASTVSPDFTGRWPSPKKAPAGTAFIATSDSNGMAVSYIQSNYWGIGSGLSAGATGVFLQNRGAGFNLIQGHPNEYTPGHRPMHTLAPTLWTKDTSLELVLGTRGGDQQPQYLAQFAANHFHAGTCTDDSQLKPRWTMDQPEPGTDSSITVEPRFSKSAIAGLTERGHAVNFGADWNAWYGPISAIDVGLGNKASADPRVSTSASLSLASPRTF